MHNAAAALQLGESLTIREVADLHRQLQARPSSGPSLVFDCASLNQIDGAGLQLLLACARHEADRGGRMQLSNLSPDLRQSLIATGGWGHLYQEGDPS